MRSRTNRSFASFESLEDRRFLSVASDLGLTDLQDHSGFGSRVSALQTPMKLSATMQVFTDAAGPGTGTGTGAGSTTNPAVDISRMVGKFKSGKSLIFAPRIQIQTVSADGVARGKFQLPWIISRATVKGRIFSTGRFSLKIMDSTKPETDPTRYNATFKGSMSPDGNKLNGWFQSWYGPKPGKYGTPYKAMYQRTA